MSLQSEMDLDYEEEDLDSIRDRYLTFSIKDEEYGIPIAYVVEIVGVQHITAVPDMAEFVKGVINLRGRVIPVIDVRARFGMQERPYDDRTCVVIVDMESTVVGLVVDTVSEVVHIPEEDTSQPPRVGRKASNQYIQALGKRGEQVSIILSVQKLLYDGELSQLADLQQGGAGNE